MATTTDPNAVANPSTTAATPPAGAGMINTATGATPGTPGTTTAQGTAVPAAPVATAAPAATAQTTVHSNDTVAGQVANIIAGNSPVIQTARTGAAQQMNQRGLLNSSMATQAGEQAAINAALPIAQQDAQTNFTANTQNTAATNAGNQFNADLQTKVSQLNASTSADLIKAGMTADSQKQIASIEADYKTLMQSSSDAASIYNNSIGRISAILNDTNMDAAAKATAVNGITGYMKTAMNLIGSINGVDLGGLLTFSAVTPK